MAWFEYQGHTAGGTLITGRIEAGDHRDAQQQLHDLGLEVTDLAPASNGRVAAHSIHADDLMFFNEQLLSLSKAGIALDQGLRELARDIKKPSMRKWVNDLADDVAAGASLEDAVARRESKLPLLYSEILRAGVETNQLSATLLNLNQHLSFMNRTRRMVWEAAAYPVMVLLLAIAVVSFMFLLIVPNFVEIYADMDATLPGLTNLVIDAGRLAPWILGSFGIVAILAGIGWTAMLANQRTRAVRDRIKFTLPVFGVIHRSSMLARFCRAVATAVNAGVDLPRSLRLAGGASGSPVIKAESDYLAEEVEQGASLYGASQATSIIPSLFGFCAQTAAGRNDLAAALATLSATFEQRAMQGQWRIRSLLSPLLIIMVGVTVGFAIVGLYMPLIMVIRSLTVF